MTTKFVRGLKHLFMTDLAVKTYPNLKNSSLLTALDTRPEPCNNMVTEGWEPGWICTNLDRNIQHWCSKR